MFDYADSAENQTDDWDTATPLGSIIKRDNLSTLFRLSIIYEENVKNWM